MFDQGAQIEVLVKIKYNQDVWYPATIVENHGGTSFVVAYVASIEGTSKADSRKVTVARSHIRPSPPPFKDRVFVLLEKVEAFKEFGWWSGEVVKASPGNNYSVFFGCSLGEFYHTNIRPQLDWKDGKWRFRSSQEEVTQFQENPGGHVVVSELNDISSERVQESEKIKQKSPVSSCSWERTPGKKLSNGPCITKRVLVEANLEKSEFPSSSLVENQTDLVDLDHHKSHGVASSLKKVKHSSKSTTDLEEKVKRRGDVVRPSCISSRQNTAVSDIQNGGIESTSGSLPSNITGENMMIGLTGEDQPSDYPSLEIRTPKKQKKMDEKDTHTPNHRRKPRQDGEEGIKGYTKLAKSVKKDCGGKKNKVAFISLERCNSSGSKARETCLNNGEECLKLEGDQKKHVPDQPEAAKSYMKRRDMPRKVYGRRQRSLKAKMTEQISNTANNDIIIKECKMSEVDSQNVPNSMLMNMEGLLLPAENYLMPIGDELNHVKDLGSTRRKPALRMPIDSNEQALISEPERPIPKGAKHRITSENNVSKISGSSDGTVSMIVEPFCVTKEVDRTVQQEPDVVNDQPLSMCFEKMHSPSTVNSSTAGKSTAMMVEQSIESRQTRKELHGKTTSGENNKNAAVTSEEVDAQNHVYVDGDTMVEQSAELRHTRKELDGPTPSSKYNKTAAVMSEEVDEQSRVLVDGNSSVTTSGEPELPFLKSSSFWTVIESMEPLRKMPQKPHFRPLHQEKESLREGFAIAFMVHFSSTVEKISLLKYDGDTKQEIDDILDSLDDLESQGFEVQVLRDRINELESIKEKCKRHHEELDVINKQIVLCNFDKAEQDKEISEATKQIQKLQESVAKAEAIREMKDGEIAVLVSRRKEAEEPMMSTRSRYEALALGVI